MTMMHTPDEEKVFQVEKLLRVMNKLVRRRSRRILGEFGITPPQFEALLAVREHGEITVGDLSNRLYLAYSTTTDLVDRMERNSLVERIRDENDRRVVRLRILERGQEMLREAMLARRRYLGSVLGKMTASETDVLVTALSVLHSHMVAE